MAARIVDHLPLLDWLAAVHLVALQQWAARGIDFHFERHSQLTAVAKHRGMDRRQARRPCVEVTPFFEIADLLRAVGKLYLCAAANAPVTPAHALSRFQHRTSISSFAEFIG